MTAKTGRIVGEMNRLSGISLTRTDHQGAFKSNDYVSGHISITMCNFTRFPSYSYVVKSQQIFSSRIVTTVTLLLHWYYPLTCRDGLEQTVSFIRPRDRTIHLFADLSIPSSSDAPHSIVLNSHHLSDLILMSSASAAQATCSQG